MIAKPKAPRVHWDAEQGWVVDTQIALSPAQLQRVIAHTKRIQSERVLAMPRGDRKDQATQALKSLSLRSLKVNLLPESGYSEGERELYLNRG